MSKRHKKTKLFSSAESDMPPDMLGYVFDTDALDAPRHRKLKGRHRRETHKFAYYD